MNVTLTARKIVVPDELKEYAKDKFSRLDRFFDKIQDIAVVIKAEDRHINCEAVVHMDKRGSIVISVDRVDMRDAIDSVLERCEHQLRRQKEMRGERRRAEGEAKRQQSERFLREDAGEGDAED